METVRNRTMHKLSLSLVSAFIGLSASMTFAQDVEEEESSERDRIIVSAARIEQPASAIPGTVTVIEKEEIELQQLLNDDLASVLENTVPGFGPSLQKLTGRAESLRGRNPLYLVDGVPQHNALRDGQRDGHFIDLDFVERIEVINGSNAIQGVGATGGVISMLTRSPSSSGDWETTLNTRFTAPDDLDSDGFGYKVSAITGRRFGDFEFSFGASLFERGLFFDANGDAVGLYPTQGDIMDSTTVSLFVKAAWQINSDADLTFMATDFDLERNGDFRAVAGDRDAGILSGTVAGDPSEDVGDPARNEVTTASLTFRHERLFGGSFSAQLFDQSFDGLFEGGTFGGFFRLTPNGDPFLDQSAVVSDKNGLKMTWSRPLDERDSNFALGLDFFRDESAQVLARSGRKWVPETRFETLAPFVQGTWSATDSINVVGGLRYEDATLEVDDFTTIAAANSTFVEGGSPEFSETLLNAGIIWDFAGDWSAYASFNEASRCRMSGECFGGSAYRDRASPHLFGSSRSSRTTRNWGWSLTTVSSEPERPTSSLRPITDRDFASMIPAYSKFCASAQKSMASSFRSTTPSTETFRWEEIMRAQTVGWIRMPTAASIAISMA